MIDEAVYAVAAEFEEQVGQRLDGNTKAKPHEVRRSVFRKWSTAAERARRAEERADDGA